MISRRFLVVDDSPAVIKRMSLVLESLGHEVVGTAGNGLDAVAKADRLNPDVISMDLKMPGQDGFETTCQILAKHPDKPVIILTAHGQETHVLKAIEAGAKYFITKPIEKEKIEAVLRKVFGDA